MSSILKALKKLEHEKSGHVPDLLKIDSDILKSTDSSRSFSLPSLGLLLLFFGSGVVVAFFIMRGANVPPATIKIQPDVSSKSVQPLAPPALLNREALPAEIAIAPAHNELSGEVSRKDPQKSSVVNKVADNKTKVPVPHPVLNISEKSRVATIPVKNETKTVAVPTLRVYGIAFQNSGSDSMAIVNGMPVSNGSIIEGATVREVQKDRVLFQYNGEKFEISLGQSNR